MGYGTSLYKTDLAPGVGIPVRFMHPKDFWFHFRFTFSSKFQGAILDKFNKHNNSKRKSTSPTRESEKSTRGGPHDGCCESLGAEQEGT